MEPDRHATPNPNDVIPWLLAGDTAVAYQTRRDLLGEDRPDLRAAIADDGDVKTILGARNPDGHWGRVFYQPKWTSTHYTLLELRQLELPPTNPIARNAVGLVLREKGPDGGLNPSGTIKHSDACINGMALDYATWFGAGDDDLSSIIDFLLSQVMPDGGYNCRRNRSGARISSVHTTLSVIEGFTTYLTREPRYRAEDVRRARAAAIECLLSRELFRVRGTAMKAEGVRRLLVQSSLGAGDSARQLPRGLRLLMTVLLAKPLADHNEQESIVRGSGLDWTMVRPSGLTDKPASGHWQALETTEPGTLKGTITRADLAACMLATLHDETTIGKALGVSGR